MGIIVSTKIFLLDFIDFIFPNFCLICSQKIIRSLFSICKDCLEKLEISNEADIYEFYKCNFSSENLISDFYSRYEFVKDGYFQKVVHQLKYHGKSRVGILLGRELGKELLKQKWFDDVDFLVPVPIHRIKKFKRGYNQSSLIVKGIFQITKKPAMEGVIKRIKNTETQINLNMQERIENVVGAFRITDKSKITGKNILIIDDVCTTGSTVKEIARTFLNSGAKKINLATLAFVKEIDYSLQV